MRLLFWILLFLFLGTTALEAQNILQRPRNPDYPGNYSSKFLRRSSLMATVGSGYIQDGFSRLGQVGLGEISYAYALNRNLDLGVSLYGSLLCNKAYYDDNGQIQSTPEDPTGKDCNRAWTFGSTVLALARYYPFEDLPAFGQLGLGYALDGEAPVGTIGFGYSYRFIERIAVLGLLRYAALVPLGSTPDWVRNPGGLRLEFGLIWHH